MEGGEGKAERGRVTVENRQAAIPLEESLVEALSAAGTRALALIIERGLLLGEVIVGAAVFLVDDAEIGRVHGDYFDDPSPTDVITFPLGNYGEILVGVETARRQAGEFGAEFDRELALYVVHGVLHLCGYEDQSEAGRVRMAELQDAIVAEVY